MMHFFKCTIIVTTTFNIIKITMFKVQIFLIVDIIQVTSFFVHLSFISTFRTFSFIHHTTTLRALSIFVHHTATTLHTFSFIHHTTTFVTNFRFFNLFVDSYVSIMFNFTFIVYSNTIFITGKILHVQWLCI